MLKQSQAASSVVPGLSINRHISWNGVPDRKALERGSLRGVGESAPTGSRGVRIYVEMSRTLRNAISPALNSDQISAKKKK